MRARVAAIIIAVMLRRTRTATPAARRRVVPAWAVVALVLAGCQSTPPSTTAPASAWEWRGIVYRMDINQGNFLTQDMVDRLKAGQSRQQVRLALGTPLVQSAFHQDRWDYVYQFQSRGRMVEQRQFAVYFVDDKLARWEGDEMPPSVADLNRAAAERTMPRMPQADDPGLLGWFFDLFRTKP